LKVEGPQALKAKEAGMRADGKTRKSTLSHPQFYRLCEWLHAHKARLEAERPGLREVAAQATRDLQHEVTASNVTSARDAAGVHWKMQARRYGGGLKARMNRVEALVEYLYGSLGIQVPGRGQD
jgi:hypothetical protein